MINSPVYKSLGDRTRTLAGSHHLYLASDHLLYVVNSGFSERYKRFFFTDVQALVLSESTRRTTFYFLLGFATGAAVLVSFFVGMLVSLPAGFITLASLAVLLAFFFGWNAYLGPTCTCSITTAVQVQILPSLCRIRRVLPILDQIQELVLRAQSAPVAPEPVLPVVAVMPIAPAPGPALRPWLHQKIRHEKGGWHVFLFCMLLLDSAITAADMAWTGLAITLISSCQTMVVSVAAVGALIRQRDSDLPRRLRALVWSTLGYLLLMFGLGYCYFIFTSIAHGDLQPDQWEWLKTLAATSVGNSPFLAATFGIGIFFSTLLGFWGLWTWRQHARAHANSAPSLVHESTSPEPPT